MPPVVMHPHVMPLHVMPPHVTRQHVTHLLVMRRHVTHLLVMRLYDGESGLFIHAGRSHGISPFSIIP